MSNRPAGSGIPKAGGSGIPRAGGSGIPRTGASGLGRQSSFGYGDSVGPKSRATIGRQSSFGSRPSTFGQASAMKNFAGGATGGVFGQGQLNSARKSIFQSARKSVLGGNSLSSMTPLTKRPSFNPGSAASSVGRMSIGGQRSAQEDRPISETSYHKECIQTVNKVFESMGQQTLPPRFVISPSSSDIRRVFEILFSRLGFSLNEIVSQNPGSKWDQEILPIVRGMGYRYDLPKKDLAMATSSNRSKGQIFGLFEWLANCVPYAEKASFERVVFPEEYESIDIKLFKVAMLGDEGERDIQFSHLTQEHYGTEEKLEELKNEELLLKSEISAEEDECKQFADLRKLCDNFQTEIAQFDKYISDMNECIEKHRETAYADLTDIEGQIEKIRNDIKVDRQKKVKLTEQVDHQMFGQDDVRMTQERQQQLKDEIEAETRSIEELKRSIREIRLGSKQNEDKLMKVQSEIHSSLTSLRKALLSPHLGPYVNQLRKVLESRNFNRILEFLLDKPTFDDEANRIRNQLQGLIQDVKMSIVVQTVALEGDMLSQEEHQNQELDSLILEEERKVEEVKKKVAELREQVETLRIKHNQEYNSIMKEYETNKEFLIQLEEKMKQSVSETRSRISKKKSMLEKQKAELGSFESQKVSELKEYVGHQDVLAEKVANLVSQKVTEQKIYKEALTREADAWELKVKKRDRQLKDYHEKKAAKESRSRSKSKENASRK